MGGALLLACAKTPVDGDTASGGGGGGGESGGTDGTVQNPQGGSAGSQPSDQGGRAGTGGKGGTQGNGGATVTNPNTGSSKAGGSGGAGRGGSSAQMGGSPGTAGRQGSGGASSGAGGTPPPIASGCNGYATRFWDCCKPHCSWPGNVSGGVKPTNSCSASNGGVDANAQSSCNGGSAHMCYGLTPWAVNANLAYGFAATSNGDVCGKCFALQFTGSSHNGGDDPGSRALQGKTIIVQAMNIGFDVGGGQFDIAIPGGGVGAFNACSAQWGVSNNDLGAQYGGFLSVCRQQNNNNHEAVKSCVSQKCTSVFQSRGLNDLAAACQWFVQWYQAADNPALKYKEVVCPQELSAKSGMMRASVSNTCGN